MTLALLSTTSYAQDGEIPDEFLEDVQYYIGDWTSEVKSGDRVTEGTWSAKWSAEGKCLIIHMSGVPIDQEVTEGQENAFGTGILGWDPSTNGMKDLTFWSSGNTYDARYRKTSDTTWEGDATGTVGGKEFTEKVSLTRNGEDEFVWRAYEYVLDGEKQPDIVATIRKVAKPDSPVAHEKLEEAFGWLIGDWEVGGDHDQFGEWTMIFSFDWDVDGKVVAFRVNYNAENLKWTADCRNYWDAREDKIKNITFVGPSGSVDMGVVTESSKNKITWLTTGLNDDGTKQHWESQYSLRDDGTLVFRHMSLLDDGSKRENWKFEFSKK